MPRVFDVRSKSVAGRRNGLDPAFGGSAPEPLEMGFVELKKTLQNHIFGTRLGRDSG
jgi:hypothetical protein